MRPIHNIQVLRALAALIVVIFHIQGELRHRGLDDPFPDLTMGAFGVDLFFVISGFIMVYASVPLLGTARASVDFLSRRIVRIVPLYWLFTTAFALIAIVLAQYPGHAPYSMRHILASYLFIPAARPEDGAVFPTYSLGWTLNYEMFFYLCFSAALSLRGPWVMVSTAAFLAVLVTAGSLVDLPWPLAYWANSLTLEFGFGMVIAQAYLQGLRLPLPVCIGLAAAALTGVWLFVPYIDSRSAWRGIAWGLPAAALVCGAVSVEWRRAISTRRVLESLGNASYSLYLVHSALFIVVASVLTRAAVDLHRVPSLLYAALLLSGSLASAYVLFGCFERPVTRYFQARLPRQPGAAQVRAEERSPEPTGA